LKSFPKQSRKFVKNSLNCSVPSSMLNVFTISIRSNKRAYKTIHTLETEWSFFMSCCPTGWGWLTTWNDLHHLTRQPRKLKWRTARGISKLYRKWKVSSCYVHPYVSWRTLIFERFQRTGSAKPARMCKGLQSNCYWQPFLTSKHTPGLLWRQRKQFLMESLFFSSSINNIRKGFIKKYGNAGNCSLVNPV
jgi:hypothetical protein